jgi:hypothetical protein
MNYRFRQTDEKMLLKKICVFGPGGVTVIDNNSLLILSITVL